MVVLESIIVTFFGGRSGNYGSMLQAAALRTTLSKMGVESRFLGKFGVLPLMLSHPSLFVPRLQRKLAVRTRGRWFIPTDYIQGEQKKNRLARWREEETPVVNITSSAEWRKVVENNTVFIAGSDITWNPANGMPGKFFLDFAMAANLPCFSYAASIGTPQLPRKWARWYRRSLRGYIAVGVREVSTIELLRPFYDGTIEQVLDPTLLLTSNEWDRFADKAELSVKVIPEEYVLCYFVMGDSRYWLYAERVHEFLGLPVIVLPMHASDGIAQGWVRVEDATPYEFVWLIKHAAAVVTDSFHACSFCLTYEREFYLLRRERKAEDSKYDDFLHRYGLENRSVAASRFVVYEGRRLSSPTPFPCPYPSASTSRPQAPRR